MVVNLVHFQYLNYIYYYNGNGFKIKYAEEFETK